MKYTCINIQGNFISEEVIQKVETASADFQKATDFGFEPGTNLRDEIEYSWSRIKLDWKHFSEKSDSLPASDQYGTTLARKWMENFFSSIGFELNKQKEALKGENNQTYTISHVATNNNGLPAQIVGFYDPLHLEKNTLDVKSSGGTSRLSPHGTVQEYLNVTEHIYGFATNGMLLRLIRDSGRLVKLTYMEFDLKRMLDEDKYSEFTILYRLIHSSRFNNEALIIDKYYQESIETGNRIRDGLSDAVKESMQALGNGFLQHPANEALREKLKNKTITPKQYYDQLRRLVYRLLFLMVTEERDLIYEPNELKGDVINKKQIYLRYYSIARLRNLSENRYLYEKEFTDLWQGLLNTFFLFEAAGNGSKIGIKPLDGDLFSEIALKDINGAEIGNHVLLECIRNLNEFQDKETKMLVSINYRSLDVEELGSVYESLLELHPIIEHLDSLNPANVHFTFHGGTERKTTGSYYTRPDLVNELIKSALIPVIEERVKEAGGNKENQLKALIKLKVCDAAAGSGHIMLAAARTIAWYLARIDSGEENPAPTIYRHWLRQAIQHCIYAVDMNPDAVELCKLALWLEGHNSGKPLSFLDHKIRCGNSLVGVAELSMLKNGLPDDAFNPVTGDDKAVCLSLKKANKEFNKTQQITLDFDAGKIDFNEEQKDFAQQFSELDRINQDTLDEVKMISKKHRELKFNPKLQKDKNACDFYTAAFFFTYKKVDDPSAPSSQKLKSYLQSGGGVEARAVGWANVLSQQYNFFHWPLEFPDVFEQGGFDVMMGNPPWERIKLQEVEYFASRDAVIAKTDKKSERSRLIKMLPETNPQLYKEFQDSLHFADAQSKFIRSGRRYPLTGVGDINTYAIFAEHFYNLVNNAGRISVLLPTGIATDESTSNFFRTIVEKGQLESFWGYKNEKFLFPKPVEHTVTFGIMNVSGKENKSRNITEFCWLAYTVEEANDEKRKIRLTTEELKSVNPNTVTSPIPRTQYDFQLLLKFYKNHNILINTTTLANIWKIKFSTCFHMSNDSSEFNEAKALETKDYKLQGNLYVDSNETYIPLYESKMAREYDHRFGSYEGFLSRSNSMLPTPDIEKYTKSDFVPLPWYWVKKIEVVKRTTDAPSIVIRNLNKEESSLKIALLTWLFGHLIGQQDAIFEKIKKLKKEIKKIDIQNKAAEIIIESTLSEKEASTLLSVIDSVNFEADLLSFLETRCPKWLLGFRNVARSTDERTGIFSVIPFSGVGNSFPLILSKYPDKAKLVCLIGNLSSIPFDWVVRQKIAGVNMNFFYVEQLPVIEPDKFENYHIGLIVPKIIEQIYSSWDIKAFADDVWKEANEELREKINQQWKENKMATGGHEFTPPDWGEIDGEGINLPPFKWDEERRAILKAELDAIYAKLYGLTDQELRYILNPQDVYGDAFPGETFRVLKDKEIKKFGEYRTKRLVLEAWERLNKK